jgi:carbon-monoxide dehydrogenase medium subunit
MWPGEFDYARPATVAEALQLLADNEDAKLLAGGHSLLPAMKLRLNEAPLLIDISRIDGLSGISNNGSLSIGALCTHAEIAASAEVHASCMALATATGMVGDQQVRNWGTLGGNVAHADPASDPPTVLVAFNANINIAGAAGSRSVAATDFFMDLFTVDLEPGEIITSIEIPAHPHDGCSYVKMSHPASRYAVVGICAVLHMDGDSCSAAHVAVGGATVRPMRSPGAEAALGGSSLDAAALDAAAAALKADIADELIGDMSFPEDYRQEMAGVYLKRAVKAACG